MTANEKARAAAVLAGRTTYSHEVVEIWPACVDCGTPIRRNVVTPRIGLYRACGCPDVLWHCTISGWERTPTPAEV